MIIGIGNQQHAHYAGPVHAVRPAWKTVLLLLLLSSTACESEKTGNSVTVAVAANFLTTAQELVADFEASSGLHVQLVSASTGVLHAQIINGAPFDVLLAADQNSPQRLEADGRSVAGSRFVYAVGALSFCRANGEQPVADGLAVLNNNFAGRLAIANPAVAPYGLAAEQVLATLELPADFPQRLVKGENVTQTYAMVATGSVDYGLVARASVFGDGTRDPASCWPVPTRLHAPLRQEAVLLSRAAAKPAAAAFMTFLQSSAAQALIARHGYGVEP